MRKISHFFILLFVLLLVVPILPLLSQTESVPTSTVESTTDTTDTIDPVDEQTTDEPDATDDIATQSAESNDSIATDLEIVTVFRTETDKQEEMSMRDYLIGVVFSEMPASFEQEALKAQVVVAYTYAQYQLADDPILSDSPATHQAYQDYETLQQRYGDSFEEYYDKIAACVDAVYPAILTYEDEPILAAFHAASNGMTESSENVWGGAVDYLVAVESPGDPLCSQYESSTTMTKSEVYDILTVQYPDLVLSEEPSDWFANPTYTDSGYVDSIQVGTTSISGQTIRTLFSLRSACFSISYRDGTFTIDTLGYGHGVGMSQYGANYYASIGWSYEEILAHYYPNTTLTVQ